MTVEELLDEVEKLSAEDKARLLEVLGPRLCCGVMTDRAGMHGLMRECMSAMPGGGMGPMGRPMKGGQGRKGARRA